MLYNVKDKNGNVLSRIFAPGNKVLQIEAREVDSSDEVVVQEDGTEVTVTHREYILVNMHADSIVSQLSTVVEIGSVEHAK